MAEVSISSDAAQTTASSCSRPEEGLPCLELKIKAHVGIFRILNEVGNYFVSFMRSKGFEEILLPAYLPHGSAIGDVLPHRDDGVLYDLMNHFKKEFCASFFGLQTEMVIRHYFQLMDVVEELFVTMFDNLNEMCQEEFNVIKSLYPFESLQYSTKTLRLSYKEAIQMLENSGLGIALLSATSNAKLMVRPFVAQLAPKRTFV